MCTQCEQEISLFRQRTTPSPWKLPRQIVADRLVEILANPDSIQQGATGLCGNAAFLWAWIRNDHLSVARFTIDLYEKGRAVSAAVNVSASADLLNCDWATLDWTIKGGWEPCPPTEWMIMSALQDVLNGLLVYSGCAHEGWAEGLNGDQVVDCLSHTGLYSAIGNSCVYWRPFAPGIAEVVAQVPDDDTDVILCINAQLIQAGAHDSGPGGFINNDAANHFVGLVEPVTLTTTPAGATVHLKVFTWGGFRENDYPANGFASNYYGQIVTQAKSPKKPLPAMPTSLPLAPFGLSATLAGDRVMLSWKDPNLHVTGYDLAESDGHGSWSLNNARAQRPSTLGASYIYVLGKPWPATKYFKVRARNDAGDSDWSLPVMISLPSGATRELRWWDDDISLPPMHVRQLTVLRAPAGLTPIGYARFAEADGDCARAQLVYEAAWEETGVHSRELRPSPPMAVKLKPNRTAYVFVKFASGPANESGVLMQGRPVTARFFGMNPSTSVDLAINLNPGPGGKYYWGSFQPANPGPGELELQVQIDASDSFTRFAPRTPSGHELDSKPADAAWAEHEPPFTFRLYTPGVDLTHKLRIGVRKDSVAALGEPNDDFGKATLVPLTPAPGSANATSTHHVSLSGRTDVDYYCVQFDSSAKDKAFTGTGSVKVVLSKLLGLGIVHYPSQLDVRLSTSDLDCMDVDLFASAALGRTLVSQFHGKSEIVVASPTLAGYPDGELYVVVKNADFTNQGAFLYDAEFAYTHAVDRMTLDFNAPAYRGNTTAARKLFRSLYDALDLPRPSENPVADFGRDVRSSLTGLAAFLLQPSTATTLTQITGRDARADIAAACASTAKATGPLGMEKVTEQLYQSAASGYRSVGNAAKERAALTALAGYYKASGSPEKATAILSRLGRIVGPVKIIR